MIKEKQIYKKMLHYHRIDSNIIHKSHKLSKKVTIETYTKEMDHYFPLFFVIKPL